MGLVLGNNGMAAGSDMIQIVADGINSRVYDKFSQGFISPPQDQVDNVEATFRFFEDGLIRFTIERPLDTGDAEHDFLLPTEQEFQLGWAVNANSMNMLGKHTHAGGLDVMLMYGMDTFEESGKEGAAYMM